MSRLLKKLKEYDDLYYNEGKSPLTDTEYDILKEKAKKRTKNSYFEGVGAEPKKKKVTLPYILGSLDKKKIDTVEDWLKTVNSPIVVSSKIDGVSLYVEYENGEVVFAATRGKTTDNESIGTDITEKAKIFCKPIEYKGKVVLRGECVLRGDIYKELGFSNPRNGCAGIINRDDNEGVEHITPYFHEVIEPTFNVEFNTEIEKFYFLENIDLNVPTYNLYESLTRESIIDIFKAMKALSLEYKADGLVLTPNDYVRENVTIPKNKVAFKLNEDAVRTRVERVEFRTTRTGRVVPLVWIEPVEIDGSKISKATGFNVLYIKENGIGVGAEIGIVKSGDIIPFIEEVYITSNISIPDICPSCGGELKYTSTNTDLICDNPKCGEQNSMRIEHFFRTLGVENLTRKTLDKLELTEISDFYNLKKEELEKIEGIGEKKAELILEQINNTKNFRDDKLLAAFGIKGVGEKMAKLILSKFTLQELFTINELELTSIKGVGDKLAQNIVNEINKHFAIYMYLKRMKGKENTPKEDNIKQNPLNNDSFAITGKHPIPRNDIIQIIEANGGNYNSSVTNSTKYLIVEDVSKKSKKIVDAEKRGVKSISFDDFMWMIGE